MDCFDPILTLELRSPEILIYDDVDISEKESK